MYLNEFRNSEEYLDNCNVKPELKSLCDPFSFFDFYEKEIWLNAVLIAVMVVGFFSLSFFLFVFKFTDKKVIHRYDKEVIDKYAIINPHPRKVLSK